MNGQHDRLGEDYLWNRRDPVDLEVARLEQLLAPYALREPPHRLSSRRRGNRLPVIAVAAALACLVLAGIGWYWQRLQWPAGQPWQLALVAGQARIDGSTLTDRSAVLPPEGVIRTGSDGVVRVEVARIGELVLGGDSQLQLHTTRSGRHRVALEHGTLWARVWAPPYSFGVGTPAGAAYDLGCEFLLRIDAQGNGMLQVASGWVQFERGSAEVLVPQGARIELHARGAPGTPYALDAAPPLVSALRAIDAAGRQAPATGPAVQQLLAQARPQDAITLVSLLTRYPQLAGGPVLDRAMALLEPGGEITRQSVRAGDPAAVDALWKALPYPRAKQWWLQWPDGFAGDASAPMLLNPPPR